MVDSVSSDVDVLKVSHVIQRRVDVLENVLPAVVVIDAHRNVLQDSLVKIASKDVLVEKMA